MITKYIIKNKFLINFVVFIFKLFGLERCSNLGAVGAYSLF